MDTAFKKNSTAERIVILTVREIFEGSVYYHQDQRISDSLNAPNNRETPYIALKDVEVRCRETGQVTLRTRCLLLKRARIEYVIPRAEIQSFPGLDEVESPIVRNNGVPHEA